MAPTLPTLILFNLHRLGGRRLVRRCSAAKLMWVRSAPNSTSILPPVGGPGVVSGDVSCKETHLKEKTPSKKRVPDESLSGPPSKACREKLQRDKLNHRFLEVCSVLDPIIPSKGDKGAILRDATQVLNQLRAESQKLKEANEALHDKIKNLKAEKIELRDEKLRLKVEKEGIEHAIKSTGLPSTIIAHPSAVLHPAAYAANSKTVIYPNYSPVAMWQWIPPAAMDTSQDHVLTPPVA